MLFRSLEAQLASLEPFSASEQPHVLNLGADADGAINRIRTTIRTTLS